MPAVSAAKDVASIRPTEPRPLPKLLGIKSRDRMGRDHSYIPRSKPTPAARFPVTYETFCTRRPSEVNSVVEPITTTIECDDTLRSGGWEIARNRSVSQGRFCPRLGKNRSYFNAGLETLNQRVQGSSPCAPPDGHYEIAASAWMAAKFKFPHEYLQLRNKAQLCSATMAPRS
jgi:hypothetical protein